MQFCSCGGRLFIFLFSSPRVKTGPGTMAVNLWPVPGETLSLVISLFRRGSKRRHPMDHKNGASVPHRSTLVPSTGEICMHSPPPLKTESAPERPAADSRKSSEKLRSNQLRRQRVSFLAEAFSDLSTIRILKAGSLISGIAFSLCSMHPGNLYTTTIIPEIKDTRLFHYYVIRRFVPNKAPTRRVDQVYRKSTAGSALVALF